MNFKRVVVTGGAGFVGSNLSILLKRDHPTIEVVALDNLRRRGSELAIERLRTGGVGFEHGDIRNPEDFEAIGACDLIIECSAEPSVHAGYGGSPAYVINTNLLGTVNCLEHARRHGSNLVFLSTSRVYPIAALRALPLQESGERLTIADGARGLGWSEAGLNENFPLTGSRSIYGATKLASELLIEEYRDMYGINAVINRCGVLTGPWQMGKVDQGVIVLWMARHVFGGKLAFMGFGGHGHQVRDLLHVNDLYDLVSLQLTDMSRHSGAVYNVGGGNETSVSLLELTALCRRISGNIIDLDIVPETRTADIPYYITDNSRITAATGWSPRTSVEAVLVDIHDWLRGNRTLLDPLFN